MRTSGAQDSVENHGAAMDQDKNKVRCKYCGKEVRGFNHLEHHLGGVGNDVAACLHVPDGVRTRMREGLLTKEMQRLVGEVGVLFQSHLSHERNTSSPLSEPTPAGLTGNGCVPMVEEEAVDVIVKNENNDCSSSAAAKCVGRFFYETGIDLNAIKSPSFQKMMDAAIKCGSEFKVPELNELRGWILEEDFGVVHGRVQGMKRSWEQTGCTILFDIWTDQRGKSLISFLVDNPRGTVFLRSVDAFNIIQDTDALVSLLSRVIEEVRVHNVVQVITFEASSYMMATGKKLMEKYELFWTVCVDYCINLILERIESMDHVRQVLAKAKSITRFIYSHGLPRELMGKHITEGELVKTSMLKSVASFMTLEKLVSQKENLMSMFTSQAWSRSTWSSKIKGKMICDLVNDSSFWDAAADILKITNPLIGVLHQINGGDAGAMGFVYDMMDRAKLEIKKGLGDEEAAYLPYWSIIDDIWNSYLHSPLHSAAYYLNPSLFYSNDFFVDDEVTDGLLVCAVRLTDNEQQDILASQLNSYRAALGGFKEEMAINQRSTIHPAIWWSTHGGQCPELRKFAVKILSQTCSTSSRHKLRKGSSEQLHSEGMNPIDRQKLSDMEFVQNNLRLWQSQGDSIGFESLAPLEDWTVERI